MNDFEQPSSPPQFPARNPVNGRIHSITRMCSDGRELVGSLDNLGVPYMVAQGGAGDALDTPRALAEPVRLGTPELVTDYGVKLRGY